MTMTTADSGTGVAAARRRRGEPYPAPEPVEAYPDRAALLQERAQALNSLVREDFSRLRGLYFLVCAGLLVAAVALAAGSATDAVQAGADGHGGERMSHDLIGFAATVVAAAAALLGLRSIRSRDRLRWQRIQAWYALERTPAARALPAGDIPAELEPADQHPRVRDRYIRNNGLHLRGNLGAIVALACAISLLIVLTNADTADLSLTVTGAAALVTTGVLAWRVTAKYSRRYRWAGQRQSVEATERNRTIFRERLTAPATDTGAVTKPYQVLAAACMAAPTVVILGAVCIARPRTAANLGVIVAGALGVFLLLLPFFLVRRLRERRALHAAFPTAAAALPTGSTPYAVHFGLNEDDAHDTEPATWDRGPARAGSAALTTSALHLRGPAGEALDITLTDILGAVHSPQWPWLADGSLDLHLHTGEAIELRTPQHRHLATELASAGVRVLRA
ncbi:hypothetical protein [Streptomyces ochraceiscleroticus]|uniref:Integral membrane protein n=1 Tax=Streptomyces ochraceiscleroticus TaxID=47761 RepID=A0ABW1MLT4_9ACTN|nr:hypothetical protein [Streptomyces ochraceiscleroticus]